MKDWDLMLPYLRENENLFGVMIERDLLTNQGTLMDFSRIYRKIEPIPLQELT